MVIDLHNHTRISSRCSILSPEVLIKTAKGSGLDAICVTEHVTIDGANLAREMGHKLGFPVFRGIEARTDLGDMLVYGYYKDIPEYIPLSDLCSLVHENGGVVFAAHPFRTGACNLYESLLSKGIDLKSGWKKAGVLRELDGIEILNGQTSKKDNLAARQLQQNLCIKGIGGSDAHSVKMVGRTATIFQGRISSEEELVHALLNGSYKVIRLR